MSFEFQPKSLTGSADACVNYISCKGSLFGAEDFSAPTARQIGLCVSFETRFNFTPDHISSSRFTFEEMAHEFPGLGTRNGGGN